MARCRAGIFSPSRLTFLLRTRNIRSPFIPRGDAAGMRRHVTDRKGMDAHLLPILTSLLSFSCPIHRRTGK
jgi:hypothetical protein